MSQSKKQSMIEVITNTSTGMLGSFAITFLLLHFLTDKFTIAVVTTMACTAWSLLRGYGLRRYFNSKVVKV